MSEKPTPEELKAVSDLLNVLKAFPKSLYISVSEDEDDAGVTVMKRIRRGMSKGIGSYKSKTIVEVF